VVVIGVIVAYFRFLPANRPWLRLSLGLQLGGALGNLIDRLRQGYVVDFIYFKNMPVFNIADCCIVVGVAILAFHLLFLQSQPATTGDAAQQSLPQPITPPQVALGEHPPSEG
jgi:signal peptidase II